MALLAFDLSTLAMGALGDGLSLCQPALLGIFISVLVLFVRDKRQMAKVGLWTLALSFVGTGMGAYGAFSGLQARTTPVMAEFAAGLLLFAAGLVEMYRHELLKYEPSESWLAKAFKWLRRSTLPLFALGASILQPPCSTGPYPLLLEALSIRPGQFIEAYLLTYLLLLFLPFLTILLVWFCMLSIPGAEQFKVCHKLGIRLAVGAITAIIGVILLWNTHAITLLPGLAHIGS